MSLLKLISAVILSAAVCACSPAPRINAQSEASAKASILKLTEKMTPEELEEFNNAIYGIMATVKNDIDHSDNPDRQLSECINKIIDGKTANEILILHKKLLEQKRCPLCGRN